MTITTEKTITEYQDEVLLILESFDYPNMVYGYRSSDVAYSMAGSIVVNYFMGISPMMCAIIIWSLTLNEQIMPDSKGMVKH
jgi:hypothetical protein